MNNFRYKMAQFFAGRTGPDDISKTVAWTGIIFMFLTMIFHSTIFYLLFVACAVYSTWRVLSKNYQKRYNENQIFLHKTAKIRAFFNRLIANVKNKTAGMQKDFDQRKTYAIFKCPSCKQKLRAPRGRGKIQVTCSKCHAVFIKKV